MRKYSPALATLSKTATSRRKLLQSITAVSLGIMGGISTMSASRAAASGQIGYIAVQGAELFVHPTNLSPILYMDEGVAVDVLYGPHEGLYEIRYYGTDGWIWADYLSFNGAPASNSSRGGGEPAPVSSSSSSSEHWVDVNRSTGLVCLMIGSEVYTAFWASLGWEQTNYGFYATALGTYYVYGFRYELHYTAYADNYISHWVAFDPERFNGFHSYTKDKWGNIVPNGDGNTAGCVALAPGDIDQLYDFAHMNMRVEIHW